MVPARALGDTMGQVPGDPTLDHFDAAGESRISQPGLKLHSQSRPSTSDPPVSTFPVLGVSILQRRAGVYGELGNQTQGFVLPYEHFTTEPHSQPHSLDLKEPRGGWKYSLWPVPV